MKKINLTNTLTRKKEELTPRDGNTISLYVCGVTPYDFSHIGHGRSYVNFDVLVRLLRFVGYNVTYVRNVTDIEDKLLNRAERELGSSLAYGQIARKFTQAFQRDVGLLNCVTPDVEPLVTTHIPQIIAFIEKLVATGHAYQVDSDVYFDVTSAPDYGALSGKKLDELKAGARVHINEKKKHEADFVLWKGNDQNLFWQSPWGYGRPGWHIECSVLAYTYLGATIDIHGGGADLIFPHHENEIAQSQSYSHQPFVRCWVHNALLNLNKEKMSKSLGNTLALHEVFAQVDPMVVRFYLLQHTYRAPIEFSIDQVKTAVSAYKKLVQALHEEESGALTLRDRRVEGSSGIAADLLDAVADDLNTPRALGIIFERLDDIKKDARSRSTVRTFVQQVLGLTLVPLAEAFIHVTPEIEYLLQEREIARTQKDWARADALRDELQHLGYNVQDKKIR